MGKKVLLISASPRKGGNSDLLCDRFMLGAEESGKQTEKVFLRDKKINYCLACESCHEHSGVCAQKDDMAEILDKMMAADVIVMATPVYFYTVNAQIKTLIDRTYARYTELRNKDFYFIMTAANGSQQAMERTLECFRAFTSCLKEVHEKGVVYAPGVWDKGDVKASPAMEQAYEMGKNV